MRVLASLSALSLAAVTATAAMAQTPSQPIAPARPAVKTTCADYIGMKEIVKPQFIYFTVGHGRKGGQDAVFEEGVVEKVKPELDQYCAVHLTHSAYEKVLAASMASEPAGAAARHPAPHSAHANKPAAATAAKMPAASQ